MRDCQIEFEIMVCVPIKDGQVQSMGAELMDDVFVGFPDGTEGYPSEYQEEIILARERIPEVLDRLNSELSEDGG